ncbi:MAG: bifunctional 2-keto-4-hydroxyglutarate aldolase/2-keto-3-deoxy-6-phosphogluconate aldolase [Armatimonadota bacterium]|jgi:2-dehydro-3-deoxyphosphogluconate aldolase/(4S)-4-hydroxy-2-oxoglutarate aldolase
MPTRGEILERLVEAGIVAVIRAQSSDHLIAVADAIRAGGVDCIEVTMTTPNALQVISEVSEKFGADVLIGVGSVLDAETARAAVLAGAQFVVGPSFDPRVIEVSHRYDKPVVPGCFTPTEIVTAWSAGADLIKLFPATAVGPTYIKDIRGPLPQVRIVPTGGVHLDNAGDFIKAGAAALAVGSAQVDKQAVAEGRFEVVTATARKFVEAVNDARGS